MGILSEKEYDLDSTDEKKSGWANDDRIGQEELYSAAEMVLNELVGMTEHSAPFKERVNKGEFPDYCNVVRSPMDLGLVSKKLVKFRYKSKEEFVADLNLIWSNCLKYHSSPEHPLRPHAIFMRQETEKLASLIPNITVRDRAEVAAEERRQQQARNDSDSTDESDDEPIVSSRARKERGKEPERDFNASD